MRPQRWRLPARFALAALGVGLALPATAASGQAANDSLSLTVHVGYQDVVKLGEWMPVAVDIRNAGAAIEGTLEIQEALNAQPGVRGFAAYRQTISLAQGASKRVRVYVVEDATGATITARIIQNGRVTASQDSVPGSTTSALIGVLSDQGTALDDFAAIHPGSLAARVVHLRPDELADTAIPLRAFDILAIDDFATDGLTAGQRGAIVDFVQAGGQLLLGTGAAWRKTLAGLPAGILPMEISGTTVLSATPALGGASAEVATGTTTSSRAWLAQGSHPLILERIVGSGLVTMATFDWNQESIGSATATRGVLRQVMSRAFFGPGGSAQNFAYAVGGPGGFGFGAQPSADSKSSALQPVLGNMPGLDLPSLQLTGALVLIYVLLVGPVNYLVLRALRRRALAWVTVPVIAVVAAAGAYGAGVFTKGRSVQLNQVAILHLQPGADHAYQETYTGIMAPTRGDYEAVLSGGRVFVSPISANGGGFAGSDSIRVDVDRGQVTLPQMTAFTLRGFATEGTTTAPQLVAQLRLTGGKLTWTIENHSSLTFTDAVVIAGDTFQTVGTLKPGATTTVSLTPKPANPFGQPLYTRVYGNSDSGNGSAEDASAQRDALAKAQILSLLPTGMSFKGVASASNPLLVAWTHESFQDVTISGSRPRSTVQSAVALSLAVDQIGTGPLPAGVVSGRIVDVVGETSSGPPGMLLMQNGTVTYEFQPPLAAGTQLSAASLSATNPYGAKFAGAPAPNGQAGSTVQGQVWDWSRSAWSDIAYQDNGTTALPDGAVDPSSGLIRLRLSTTNGGLLAGTISLAGTVK